MAFAGRRQLFPQVVHTGCKDVNRLTEFLAKLFENGGDLVTLVTVGHAPESGGSADKVCLTRK